MRANVAKVLQVFAAQRVKFRVLGGHDNDTLEVRAKVQDVREVVQVGGQLQRVARQTEAATNRVHLEDGEGVSPRLCNVVDMRGELVGHLLQQERGVVLVKVQELDEFPRHFRLEEFKGILQVLFQLCATFLDELRFLVAEHLTTNGGGEGYINDEPWESSF